MGSFSELYITSVVCINLGAKINTCYNKYQSQCTPSTFHGLQKITTSALGDSGASTTDRWGTSKCLSVFYPAVPIFSDWCKHMHHPPGQSTYVPSPNHSFMINPRSYEALIGPWTIMIRFERKNTSPAVKWLGYFITSESRTTLYVCMLNQ